MVHRSGCLLVAQARSSDPLRVWGFGVNEQRGTAIRGLLISEFPRTLVEDRP